jgi:hypothetical protein
VSDDGPADFVEDRSIRINQEVMGQVATHSDDTIQTET